MENIKEYQKKYHKEHYKSKNLFKLKYGISKSSTVEYRAEVKRKHRIDNPGKIRARNRITVLLRLGKLKRQPCVYCGNQKSQAHHHNYFKPLNIIWVCRLCHLNLHNIERFFKKLILAY